jgi:hypothetical protein
MLIKYDAYIDNSAIETNLTRLSNQIYKLLPSREEGLDWSKPLSTIIEEFAGMDILLLDYHSILFSLLCKLEGLTALTKEDDFMFFRKTIFECLNLVGELKKNVIR